jgi:hypothetical protein
LIFDIILTRGLYALALGGLGLEGGQSSSPQAKFTQFDAHRELTGVSGGGGVVGVVAAA